MSGKKDQRVRGHLAHLGASGLLIERNTELGAIHHGPLRPIDNFYDSTLLLIPCNWTHPLSAKVSPLAWEQACWGCWVKSRWADMEKTKPVVTFHPKLIWDWRASICSQIFSASQNTNGEHLGRPKKVTTRLFPFLGKTELEKLRYSW